MIYLDNAATTFPKPRCVYDACDSYARTAAVNPGRGAYAAARDAGTMIADVKKALISLVDAREQAKVAFAPSVTIAINQILLGLPLREGSRVYVSPYEHNSVLRPLDFLRRTKGVEVIELPLLSDPADPSGSNSGYGSAGQGSCSAGQDSGSTDTSASDLAIDVRPSEAMFKEKSPDLVCMTAVSNVTGYILPFEEVFRIAKAYGATTLLDGAQAVGLIPFRFAQLHADFLTFAGHKTLYAPFGIAGTYVRNGVELSEVITGGNGIRSEDLSMPPYLPEKLESGSMNSVAIAGLAAALDWMKTVDIQTKEAELTDYALTKLRSIPGITIYDTPKGAHRTAIISFNMEGFRANEVAAILDKENYIALRAGHHCAGILHKHLNSQKYDGTIRLSPGYFNTKEDIDALCLGLENIDREKLKGIDAGILRGNC